MDRRKFFKIFGATASAPLLPFRFTWSPDETILQKTAEAETEIYSSHDCQLFINGKELSNKCFSINMDSSVHLHEMFEEEPNRRYYVPGLQEAHCDIGLYAPIPDWLDTGSVVSILFRLPKQKAGFDAILQNYELIADARDIIKANLHFVVTGPITFK